MSDQEAPLAMAAVFAADVDEDGRAEVFFDVRISGPYHVPLARLEEFVAGPAGSAQPLPAAVAGIDGLTEPNTDLPLQFFDADGDGDLDVLGQELRRNSHRDLVFWTRPRWGSRCELRVTDRGLVPGERAVVLLGIATARVPLPGIGTLLVDPELALRTSVELDNAGHAVAAFDLPPSALGLTRLYAQALLFDAAGALGGITSRTEANAR